MATEGLEDMINNNLEGALGGSGQEPVEEHESEEEEYEETEDFGEVEEGPDEGTAEGTKEGAAEGTEEEIEEGAKEGAEEEPGEESVAAEDALVSAATFSDELGEQTVPDRFVESIADPDVLAEFTARYREATSMKPVEESLHHSMESLGIAGSDMEASVEKFKNYTLQDELLKTGSIADIVAHVGFTPKAIGEYLLAAQTANDNDAENGIQALRDSSAREVRLTKKQNDMDWEKRVAYSNRLQARETKFRREYENDANSKVMSNLNKALGKGTNKIFLEELEQSGGMLKTTATEVFNRLKERYAPQLRRVSSKKGSKTKSTNRPRNFSTKSNAKALRDRIRTAKSKNAPGNFKSTGKSRAGNQKAASFLKDLLLKS